MVLVLRFLTKVTASIMGDNRGVSERTSWASSWWLAFFRSVWSCSGWVMRRILFVAADHHNPRKFREGMML